ncbi:MAG: hypothetical protein Q9181_007413 [Wetmoreana brouardii]
MAGLSLVQVSNITANLTTTSSFDPTPTLASGLTSPPVGGSGSDTSSSIVRAPRVVSRKTKIVIATVTVFGFLGMTLVAVFILRRYRKRRSAAAADQKSGTPTEDGQPYFQQKGELDAEEQRRLELEAREMRYEADGENEIHELPSSSMEPRSLPQELRGTEHSKELEVPCKL